MASPKRKIKKQCFFFSKNAVLQYLPIRLAIAYSFLIDKDITVFDGGMDRKPVLYA